MPHHLPTQPFGVDQTPVSRVALGCMRMSEGWDPAAAGTDRAAIAAFEAALEAGITFYDHADIYGGGACEAVFKNCLAAVPGSREKIFIATKVGIRSGFYDHSPEYIRTSLQGSLKRLGIDSVDLYQLHRPDPLSFPAQTAETLNALVREGLVKNIGISNYYPFQTRALQKYLEFPIVSNQISLSLLRLDPIYEGAAGGRAQSGNATCDAGDGVLDQCLELGITPLSYSPLGGGWLSGRREVSADRQPVQRTLDALKKMGEKYDGATPGQLSIAWLLKHPAGIIPLVGSNNPEHINEAAAAASIDLTREDWYALWVAARGERVP